ncbi:MAG: glycosyltransferase family 4 protein [Firmicutes bacterium]|nr:glycosyltransferase family 4 protein [Bacillota bacterium]
MRIMLVTNVTPSPGGVGSYINTLASAFRELGHQVDIVSAFGITRDFWTIEGGVLRKFKFVAGRSLGFMVTYYLTRRLLLARIGQAIRHRRYDIIHAQDVCALNQAHRCVLADGIPLILTVHGYLTREALSKGNIVKGGHAERYLIQEERIAYRDADYIITVDKSLCSYVKSFGADSNKISIIPNFVDTTLFSPRESVSSESDKFSGGVTILCPRRLVKKNGVIYAILAVKELRSEYQINARLIIAGDGPERPEIERCIRECQLDNVILLGDVPRDQMIGLYRSVDIVVIPSITTEGIVEATSIAALEAMACGVPIVASNIGGLTELIEDGENGLLVPEASPVAIAQSIHKLASDKDLRRSIIENALKRVKTLYSKQKAVLEYLTIYNNLLSDRRNREWL